MKRTFVRTKYFEKRWNALDLTEEDFRALETLLLQDPQAGDVVPHSGGLRKMSSASGARKTWWGASSICRPLFR